MRKILALFYLVFLFSVTSIFAQNINNYSTARTTGITYTSIAGSGNAISSWRSTTGLTQDDNRSFSTDIGFDFWYNGTRYTKLNVSTNGFIDFSTSTADGTGGGPYSYENTEFTANGSGTWLAVAPFYDDMTAQGGVDPLGTSIKYLVSGTAPNRVLTVEWINMAVYLNTSPSLNFQVKLYETTGVIEFVYGTMNPGSHTFSYTCGINAATLNNNPTTTQLKSQQTANSNTFNNTQQNGLVTVPASNSSIIFTPPTPAPAPTGTLSFTAITAVGMTLNWTNWCGNEVGYVIYNSTDNINFNYVAQTTANTVTYAATSLLPSTLYYWRVYAVTDGAISTTNVTNSQITNPGVNKISNATGNWNTATIWTPNGVPTLADNVTIANGTTVTISSDVSCNNLTIGQGTAANLRIGSNNTIRTINVNGNITVNANATFQVSTTSNTTHILNLINGNIINNGALNFAPDANSFCNTNFIKNGSQQISGTGTTNNFNLVSLDMGTSINNTLDIISSTFSAPANFLTLNNGTFKLSTTNTLTITPFTTTITTISNSTGITVNSTTATINFLNGINLFGNLIINNGTLNIGDAIDENLSSSGGYFQILGGAVRIAGRYFSADINNLANFLISGGSLTLPTAGSSSTTVAPFQIDGVGSSVSMSGGTIILEREGGGGAQDLGYTVTGITGGSVTGGTLQIGNTATPASQTISVNTNSPVGNLLINSANATTLLTTNSLSVFNDVTINSGTLNSNNLNISLNGNWLNINGTHIPGTGTVSFTGTNQSITKALGESFNNLTLGGAGTKTLGGAINCSGNILLSTGTTLDITASNHSVSLRQNWTNNGTFVQQNGTVTFNGTALQTIGGTSVATFNNIALNNPVGASLSTAQNLIGTLAITTGTFATNNIGFTLLSNASTTANIAALPNGTAVSGNITMQRYAPGGKTGWAMLGSPLTGQSIAGWQDDFATSGFIGSNAPSSTFKSIYTYNETTPGTFTLGYTAATNITNTLTPGIGYYVYLGTAAVNTAPINIDLTGPIFAGNKNYSISYTASSGGTANDGWNMLANPYPSALDWESAAWTRTNLNGTIYFYNADIGQYVTYSLGGVSTNGGTRYIPSSQSFWVKAIAASPALSSTENVKANAQPTFLRSGNNIVYDIENFNIKIANANYTDETAIAFKTGATKGYDELYDAYKIKTNITAAPTIASVINNDIYAVNMRPKLTLSDTIALKVLVNTTGIYTLTVPKLNMNDSLYCFVLKDKHTNTVTPFDSTLNYVFTATDTTKYARFEILIQQPFKLQVTEPTCSSIHQSITLTPNFTGTYTYSITNSSGVEVANNQSSAITYLNNLPNDTYNIQFISSANSCGIISDSVTVNNLPELQANFIISTNNLAIQATNNSIGANNYFWNFGDGDTSITNEPLHVYTHPGTYTITLTAFNNNGCNSIQTYSVVTTEPEQTVSIEETSNNNTLKLTALENTVSLTNLSSETIQSIQIFIVDISGKTIQNSFIDEIKPNDNQLFNLNNLPPSIYIVRVISNKGYQQIKIATIKY